MTFFRNCAGNTALVLLCAGMGGGSLAPVQSAYGAFGDVVTSYAWIANEYVVSGSTAYAVIPADNAVAAINLQTLQAQMISLGSAGSHSPQSLTLSPDGSRLFVAQTGVNGNAGSVKVIDTNSRSVTATFATPVNPYSIGASSDGRLFVAGYAPVGFDNRLMQISAATGQQAGPDIASGLDAYGGSLRMSPDRSTLYFGHYGLSPTTLYKYNVSSVASPSLAGSIITGSNGQDLTLSSDGTFAVHANGAPYEFAVYNTSDFSVRGRLVTGPYPRESAFSPDDSFAYLVNTQGSIRVFSLSTFAETALISGVNARGEASELFVDPSGRYLFASYADPFYGYIGTRVFDTGRVVPTPTTVLLVAAAVTFGGCRRPPRSMPLTH